MLGAPPSLGEAQAHPWALPSVDDNKEPEREDFIHFDESPPDHDVDFLADDILGRPPGYISPVQNPAGPGPGSAAVAAAAAASGFGSGRRPLPRLLSGASAPGPYMGGSYGGGQRARSATPTDGRMSSLSSCSTPAPRSDSPRSSCSTPSGSGIRAARALAQYSQNFELALFDTSKDDSDMSDFLDEGGPAGQPAPHLSAPRPPAPRPPSGSKPPSFRRSPTPRSPTPTGAAAAAAAGQNQQPQHSQTDPGARFSTPSPTPDAGAPGSGSGSPVWQAAAAGAAAGVSSGMLLSPTAPLPPRAGRKAASGPELTVRLPYSLPEEEMVPADPQHLLSPPLGLDSDGTGGRDTPQSPGGPGPPLFDWSREEAEGEEFSENNFISGALASGYG